MSRGLGTMMGSAMRLRRALRAAFVFNRSFTSSTCVCGAHSAVEDWKPPESDHFAESFLVPTFQGDAMQSSTASYYESKKVKQLRRRGRAIWSPDPKPKSELIQDPRIAKLFHLAKQSKFAELKAAHEELLNSTASSGRQIDVYTYTRLMTQCVRHVGWKTALPIFELMSQAGVVPNVVSYTIVIRALMDLAGEEGSHLELQGAEAKREACASKAIELLHEMRGRRIVPNELTYKPIMSWLPARGREAQFQELKAYMKADGIEFSGVFKYYETRLALKVGDLKKAEKLYMEAKNEDGTMASSLDAHFVNTFAKGERIEELVNLLPKVLPSINSDKSTSIAFQCLALHGKHDDALRCFAILKTKGGSRTQLSYAFTGYIMGYTKVNKVDDGLRIRKEIEEQCQIDAPPEVFNILIDTCCKNGQVSTGLDLLDEMQQRGVKLCPFSFNPFIRDFARWGMHDEAFEMKEVMGRLGVQPSVVTYSTLINACVKLGNMEKAYTLLGEMEEVGVQPNTYCYNPIIMGFGNQERLDRALMVAKEMREAGVQPDAYTYCMLIFACSVVRNEEKAVKLFEEMRGNGIQPTTAIYSAMASVFAKCGNLERSIEMVREIERSGQQLGTEAKSAILAGLSLAGRLDEALELYRAIRKQGVYPEAYSVGALLAAVGKAGDLARMFSIFEDCRGEKQWLKLTHQQHAEYLNVRCINVVLSCIRHNQLGRALDFMRKVKEENIADLGVLFDKIFLHISNGGKDENEMCWLDVEDGFTVVKAMRKLELRPSRMALEALLDGCAAMNDSDQAQRVVTEMKREGLVLNAFSQIRLFRAYVAAEDEEGALELLNTMQAFDLQDIHVQTILHQTLRPHYEAALDSQAPETLPRVRQRLEELMKTYPRRHNVED